MSHLALRRVMIRMLHDPALVRQVYADPVRALAGAGVSAEERGWLAAAPPAAWRTDPERPRRVMAALREEFPLSARLAPEIAAGFFGSPHFHRAVQERGSLAEALGEALAEHPDATVATVARLESAVARVRRAPRETAPSAPGRLRLAPAAQVVVVPGGGIALLTALRAGEPAPSLDGPAKHVLVARNASGEATLEPLSESLAALLAAAAGGAARESLLRIIRSHGADPGEDAEVLARLVEDRILI